MSIEDEVVTMLKELHAKVDALQQGQAAMKPDIVEHILRIFKSQWKDEQNRRRERCW